MPCLQKKHIAVEKLLVEALESSSDLSNAEFKMGNDKTEKRPGIFRRIGRWFKELASELKKVTWPNAKEVIKKTTIVLGVTIFFLAVIMLIDTGLSQLYKLLLSGLTS